MTPRTVPDQAMVITFAPLDREDFPMLSEWLAAPHVERWWRQDSSLDAIEAEYGPSIDGLEPTEVFMVRVDGDPIGLIQRCRISDYPEWERALAMARPPNDGVGIDYLIGDPALIGRGLGGEIIERFVEGTWQRHPSARAIVVDVQQANRRSWRALEKAGFSRTWAGTLDSDDPADEGPSYVYLLHRPVPSDSWDMGPVMG